MKPFSGGDWEHTSAKGKQVRKEVLYFKAIVKEQLKNLQGKKCAYCGLKLEVTSRSEIEHIAPKGGVARPKHVNFAFTTYNLVLSCNLCNCSEMKGQFDTIVPKTKKLNYIDNQFFIVHPYLDDPLDHYRWLDGGVLIQAASNKGAKSIEIFKLDSPARTQARAEMLVLAQYDDDDILEKVKKISSYKRCL